MRIPSIRSTTSDSDTLMLFIKGTPHVIDSAHPRFERIAELVSQDIPAENFSDAEDELQDAINFAQTALGTLRSLSERVTIQGKTIFFDGDPIDNVIADHIVKMIRSGDDNWQAPVSFLEKVQQNPAGHVRKRLFQWISDRGLTLTLEGNVIGYKGVQATDDNLSVHAGSNTVHVDAVPHTGHIPNPIGAVLTMPRSKVNNNRDAGCEQGLHVGTYSYAASWGRGRVLTVEFNPRDVVAIPKDEGYAKIRVCRYRVLDVTDAPLQETTYTGPQASDEVDEDEDVYSEEEDEDLF